MITQYAVYDVKTNRTNFYDTKEEATQAFWKNVVSFARTYYHNTAYMVVEKNDDGSQKWYNDRMTVIDAPKTKEEIEQLILEAQKNT